jgi:hypothetical protein
LPSRLRSGDEGGLEHILAPLAEAGRGGGLRGARLGVVEAPVNLAADGDASFQLALMGSGDLEWEGVEQQKTEFTEIVTRIIDRATASGQVRSDFTFADFRVLARGVMATMYFRHGGHADWRRHLDLVLDGIRLPAPSAPRRKA